MTTNPPELTAHHDTAERNRLMRFTCGVQTAQHQVNRALELALEGHWQMALELLIVCSHTVDSLKRVTREIPRITCRENQS